MLRARDRGLPFTKSAARNLGAASGKLPYFTPQSAAGPLCSRWSSESKALVRGQSLGRRMPSPDPPRLGPLLPATRSRKTTIPRVGAVPVDRFLRGIRTGLRNSPLPQPGQPDILSAKPQPVSSGQPGETRVARLGTDAGNRAPSPENRRSLLGRTAPSRNPCATLGEHHGSGS